MNDEEPKKKKTLHDLLTDLLSPSPTETLLTLTT